MNIRRWFPGYDPRGIFIAGWPGSGSTFMYQVAMELGLNVHRKKHGTRPRESMDFTVFAYRDPRDVLCSHARRKHRDTWDSDGPHAAIMKSLAQFLRKRYHEIIYESALKPNVFMVRYESFCQGNEGRFVDFLADNFLIPLSRERRSEILQRTSIESNIMRAQQFDSFRQHDEKTQIHGDHVSNKGRSGAWMQAFTPATVDRVKQELGTLLTDLGYEQDLNWSCAPD
jgi:hypothetical protein